MGRVGRSSACAGLLALCLAAPPADAQTRPLEALVSDGWGPPLVMPGPGGNGFDGLLPDLYRAIAGRLGVPVRISNLPRKRVEAELLSYDLHCYATPGWLPPALAGALAWSEPVLAHVNLVIAQAGQPAPPPGPLMGVMATTLGYVYPSLEPGFAAGLLERSDSQRAPSVVDKVAAGRTDYGVVNAVVLRWHLRTYPDLRDKVTVVREIDPAEVRCAMRPDGPYAPAVPKALAALRDSGELQAIRDRWAGVGPS